MRFRQYRMFAYCLFQNVLWPAHYIVWIILFTTATCWQTHNSWELWFRQSKHLTEMLPDLYRVQYIISTLVVVCFSLKICFHISVLCALRFIVIQRNTFVHAKLNYIMGVIAEHFLWLLDIWHNVCSGHKITPAPLWIQNIGWLIFISSGTVLTKLN